MKAKISFSILIFYMAIVLVSFTDPELNLPKRIADANFRYEFYTTDAKINPRKDKVYYWFKGGAVHNAQAGIAGILLHGKYTKTFHSNQLAEQGEFKNGLKDGIWKTWYTNGVVETWEYWRDGVRKGSFYHYNETGETLESGTFKNNKKHGEWINFAKKDTIVYKKGQVFVKKPKLTKEEKAKLKEETIKLKEEKQKTAEAEKVAKKLEKEKKATKKATQNKNESNGTIEKKSERPGFLKRLFTKQEAK